MNVVLGFVSFFLALAFSVYSGSFATLIIEVGMLLGGLILCRWGGHSREEFVFASSTFFSAFIIYALCAFFSVYFYRASGEEFLFTIDQNSFLKFSNWAVGEGSVWRIICDTYSVRKDFFGDIALFRCVQGIIAHIAHAYLDGHKPEVLIAFSFGLSAYIPIFLYKILSLRLSFFDAFKYALIFAAFSHLLYYSALIIRDVPVLLVFTIAFWFFFREFSFARFTGIGVMTLCAFSLRPESGLLFLPLAFMYVWEKMKGNGLRVPILLLGGVIGVLSLFVVGGHLVSSLAGYAEIAAGYAEFSQAENLDSGGLSVFIARLPIGIREIVRICNGFFPLLTGGSLIVSFFRAGYEIPSIIHLSLQVIGHLFWAMFFIKCCTEVRRIWSFLKQNSIMLSCIIGTFPLVLGNSFSYSHRRVLFAYLLLYVLYLFATKKEKMGGRR